MTSSTTAASPDPAPTLPAKPRNAASLLVVRHASAGPAVLMGQRGAAFRFAPNRMVFPGGAVDPADRTAPAAAEPTPALLAALGAHTRHRSRAIAMAAARELEEETGLSLGTPPRLDGLHYLCRALTPARSPIRFDARFLVIDEAATTGTVSDTGELSSLRFISVDEALTIDLMPVTRAILERYRRWHAATPADRPRIAARSIFRNERWIDQPPARPRPAA